MTGYHLRIGYLSGYSTNSCRDEAWKILVETAERIREDREAIIAETLRLEPNLDREHIAESAECFSKKTRDATLTIINKVTTENDDRGIMLLAGGGCRGDKESTRRAFCRLVIEAMHRKKIEVCLSVS